MSPARTMAWPLGIRQSTCRRATDCVVVVERVPLSPIRRLRVSRTRTWVLAPQCVAGFWRPGLQIGRRADPPTKTPRWERWDFTGSSQTIHNWFATHPTIHNCPAETLQSDTNPGDRVLAAPCFGRTPTRSGFLVLKEARIIAKAASYAVTTVVGLRGEVSEPK